MIMRVPTDQRPNIVGSTSGPEVPFPIRAGGEVIKGFGRGSKEVSRACFYKPYLWRRLRVLVWSKRDYTCPPCQPIYHSPQLGIPTANLPIEGCSIGGHNDIESGIYFGWAGLEEDGDTVEDGNSEIAGPRGTDPSIADAAGTTAAPRDEEGVSANRGVIERLNENDGPPAKDASTTRKKKFHVYPMVMSIGWNPFFKNTQRSMVRMVPLGSFSVTITLDSVCLSLSSHLCILIVTWSIYSSIARLTLPLCVAGSAHHAYLRARFLRQAAQRAHHGLHPARVRLRVHGSLDRGYSLRHQSREEQPRSGGVEFQGSR